MDHFFPRHFQRKKRFTEDQIGTYFTPKRKNTLKEERRINHVREIGRTSHRDRFGDHVLVRRRVVSNARSSFFFCLQSFFFNIRFCCLRGSRPPTLRLRLHKSCLGRRFFTIVLCWNKDARKKTQQRRRRRSKTERRRSGWFVFFSSLGVVPFRRFRRLRRTPKPSPSERLQKAGGRREKKKLLKASFFCAFCLGFQMLTFFFVENE